MCRGHLKREREKRTFPRLSNSTLHRAFDVLIVYSGKWDDDEDVREQVNEEKHYKVFTSAICSTRERKRLLDH